jgi:IclR family KDG regulon transcriptional repressor
MHRAKSDYAIQTVTNAFRLLEAFEREEALGVTELARRLHLPKNNVFRLLATLEQKGYVEQGAASDLYRLGSRCLQLGRAFSRNHGLVRARPVIEALARQTGETVHLAVLRDFQVVHLDGEQSEGAVVTGLRVGRRAPCHCTALGKVLVGCAPPHVLEEYDRCVVSRGAHEAHTAATLTDREKLIDHLRTVGSQGWATDVEEWEAGLVCAASPVRDDAGRVAAALSVSGPAFRLDEIALERVVVPAVMDAAGQLSRSLGCTL